MWIAPVALASAARKRGGARIKWPWFILFFVAASVINTYLPVGAPLYGQIATLAKIGLIVTLYLIGGNISRTTLKEAGTRPLL